MVCITAFLLAGHGPAGEVKSRTVHLKKVDMTVSTCSKGNHHDKKSSQVVNSRHASLLHVVVDLFSPFSQQKAKIGSTSERLQLTTAHSGYC
jgi:hypothetical protein